VTVADAPVGERAALVVRYNDQVIAKRRLAKLREDGTAGGGDGGGDSESDDGAGGSAGSIAALVAGLRR